MKPLKLILLAVLLIAATFFASAFINKKLAAKKMDGSNTGFAVIELFTSEGCSSCPPADAVIEKIEKESSGKPVYILAFHVDYWDHDGWKDVFSSADYTSRQKQYARWLGVPQIYTPQAVVNGVTELVGSEEDKLRKAISDNEAVDAMSQISLSVVKAGSGKVSLQYQTQGSTSNSSLVLAVVQKSAQNNIGAGENKGRTLSHVQIVRALKVINGKRSGSASIDLPNGFDAAGSEVIAFVQNMQTGLITGATRAAL
jgi:hypothetical protein